MTSLKLGKLPDRTPAKITITVGADLNQALRDYAAYLNGQHVSSAGPQRKALNSLYLLRLPRHETLPAVAMPRRPVSRAARAGGGA